MSRVLAGWLSIVLAPAVAFSQVYNPRANTTNATLAGAVAAAISGDTLRLSTGVFNEVVDISSKWLFLDGQYSNTFLGKHPAGRTIVRGTPADGSVFDINNSVVTLVDLEITGGSMNLGGNGGGINIYGNSAFTARSCRIYGNISKGYGGGIYVGQSTAYLLDTPIYSNSAIDGGIINSGCGGGLAAAFESFVSLTGASYIARNQAAEKGGGIFVRSAQVHVSDTDADVIGNQALYGGGAAVTQGVIRIDNSADFGTNVAVFCGGALFLESGSTGLISGFATSIGYSSTDIGMNVAGEDGGGIYAARSYVAIANQARLSYNKADRHGGGIFLSESTGLVDQAIIGYDTTNRPTSNIAGTNGGGVYLTSSSLVFTNDSIVRSCRAGNDGGGVYATNSRVAFSWLSWVGDTNAVGANRAGQDGGGLSLHNSLLLIDNAYLHHNAAGHFGGAIHLDRGSVMTGRYLNVKDNAVTNAGFGGAISAMTRSRFHIVDASFNNNTSDYGGGAIHISGFSPAITSTLYSVNFFANKAREDGGAAFLSAPCVLLIDGGDMYANDADADGDGSGDGGAVYVGDSSELLVDATKNNWMASYNSAQNGGAFAAEDEGDIYLVATNGNFIWLYYNDSDGHGGCAYLPEGSTVFEAQGNVRMDYNWAATNGGGLYAAGGPFINFLPDGSQRPSILRNSADFYGGGLYVSGAGAQLWLNETYIGMVSSGNMTRADNSMGGGVYLTGGALLMAVNSIFAGNTCDDSGAGLAIHEGNAMIGPQFTADNKSLLPLSRFIDNVSTGSVANFGGGGLFIMDGAALISDTLFSSNVAHRGAAIYGGYNSYLKLQNCVIATNWGHSGSSQASALRLFSSTAEVHHCTIVMNAHGGIEPDDFSALRATNCIVLGNRNGNISTGVVTYSDVGGGYPGAGNIDADPRFSDPTNLDFRLLYGSPCTNAGAVMALIDHDCINEERPLHGGYDMGAYEYNGATMDSDRDTMIDAWELQHSLNPLLFADGAVDSDDDTYLNREEYITDTDPWSDTHYLHLTTIASSNGTRAGFVSSAERAYNLFACSHAITGVWTAVEGATHIYGNGIHMELTDTNVTERAKLYRISAEMP